MSALVDTNVLVYRYDSRDPAKQRTARRVLREGIEQNTLRVPHQAIVEFVRAVTRPIGLAQFEILYPTNRCCAVRSAAYQLGWFDANIWAYAEHYGLDEILSEDFADGQLIGSVRVRNPFNAS